METSPEEDRRWRELAEQLGRDRRLARRMARFNAVAALRRDRPPGEHGLSPLAVAAMISIAGGCIGLSLLISGTVAHSYGLTRTGLTVLVTVAVITGIALVAIGTLSAKSGR